MPLKPGAHYRDIDIKVHYMQQDEEHATAASMPAPQRAGQDGYQQSADKEAMKLVGELLEARALRRATAAIGVGNFMMADQVIKQVSDELGALTPYGHDGEKLRDFAKRYHEGAMTAPALRAAYAVATRRQRSRAWDDDADRW